MIINSMRLIGFGSELNTINQMVINLSVDIVKLIRWLKD
jgi:hypothetical protein